MLIRPFLSGCGVGASVQHQRGVVAPLPAAACGAYLVVTSSLYKKDNMGCNKR